jgi:hypothetical protein
LPDNSIYSHLTSSTQPQPSTSLRVLLPTTSHIFLKVSASCFYIRPPFSVAFGYSPAFTFPTCRPHTTLPGLSRSSPAIRSHSLTCMSQPQRYRNDAACIMSIELCNLLNEAFGLSSNTSAVVNFAFSVSLSRKSSYPCSTNSGWRSTPMRRSDGTPSKIRRHKSWPRQQPISTGRARWGRLD